MAEPELSVADRNRFWSKVNTRGADECWPWTASLVRGYGQFTVKRRPYKAHRVSWILSRGPIPDGLCVCHSCDNQVCMNPAHFFLGTNVENTEDKVSKGRQAAGHALSAAILPRCLRGEAAPPAKLNEAAVRNIRARAGAGEHVRTIAATYGVTKTAIRKVVNRKSWAHIE